MEEEGDHVRLVDDNARLVGGGKGRGLCADRRRVLVIVSAVVLAAVLAGLAGLVAALAAAPRGFSASPRYASSAVSTDALLCSQHGQALLAQGGSAADAAVGVLLCLGVVHPQSSGLGGGAIFLVRSPQGDYEAIDARETAPTGANVTMFRNISSERGPLAVAVPGELAGMLELHARHGRLPWAACVERAALLCEEGFPVDASLFAAWQEALTADGLSPDSPLGRMLAGLRVGALLKRPELGAAMRRIQADGWSFYNGSLAADIAAAAGAGSLLTAEGLASYRVRDARLAETFFMGQRVVSVADEFGGSLLVQALNTVEAYNFPLLFAQGYWGQALHYLVEALKYANRLTLGDPAFEPQVPGLIAEMTSKEHAALLRGRISGDRTYPVAHYADLGNITGPSRSAGTTHASIVDASGLAVAVTSTVNLYFGSFVVAAGIILNDQMDDFSSPDRSNSFGYPPSVPNFIAPGKRPLSSMTPAIVERDGKLRLVLGGSGGSRIVTGVTQVLLQSLTAGRSVADAVGLPRLHEQLLPVGVNLEARFGSAEERFLSALGHTTVRRGPTYADAVVQAVEVMGDGSLRAACDWRKDDDPNVPCETAGA